jgi:hypothetical protein
MKPQDFTIECMAKSLSVFSDADEYLDMREGHQHMMKETVEVFECFTRLFTKLLMDDGHKLQGLFHIVDQGVSSTSRRLMSLNEGKQMKETEAAVEAVKTSLILANSRAKTWNQYIPGQDGGFSPAKEASKSAVLNAELKFLSSFMPSQHRFPLTTNDGKIYIRSKEVGFDGVDQNFQGVSLEEVDRQTQRITRKKNGKGDQEHHQVRY